MPTGYTHNIKDGVSFNEFVLQCARAFGALITMRDDPEGTPIPDKFEPSPYHANKLKDLEKELDEIRLLSAYETDMKAQSEYEEAERNRLARLDELRDLKAKYLAMLDQVEAWKPPTKEHTGLKDFMIEQISSSIKFDCGTDYYSKPTPKVNGSEWRKAKIARIEKDITYHARENEAEIKRTEDRNAWIKSLKDSLMWERKQ